MPVMALLVVVLLNDILAFLPASGIGNMKAMSPDILQHGRQSFMHNSRIISHAQLPGPHWIALTSCSAMLAATFLKRRKVQNMQRSMALNAFFEFPGGNQGPLGQKKTCIITGASSGLGLAATKMLVETGEWFIVMACRDFTKTERVAREAGLPEDSYTVIHLDLAANNSVRQFVKHFRLLDRPLDALVCNAAVYFPNAHKDGAFLPGLWPGGGPRWSADGHELSFATNYLGHFLLCNLLMEDLKQSHVKPARCIILGTVTASINDKEIGGLIPPRADVGEFQGLAKGMQKPTVMIDDGLFNGAKAYKDSKVCDVMLMRELHRRYHQSTGISFSSLYPGCIAETGLFREHYPVFRFLFPMFMQKVTKGYVSEEEAGRRLAACVSHESYTTSGSYYSWGGEDGTGGSGGADAAENTAATSDRFMQHGSFRTLSVDEIGGQPGDDELCKKLWELSEELVNSTEKTRH